MTDRLPDNEEVVAKAERLLAAIDAVPRVEYCDCGKPRAEHKYWVDHIYDVNGYSCPDSVTGSDYRFDPITTTRKHNEARQVVVRDLLAVNASLRDETARLKTKLHAEYQAKWEAEEADAISATQRAEAAESALTALRAEHERVKEQLKHD